MALLIDQLSLWEIAHRWCGADPDDAMAIGQAKVRETLRKLALVIQHTLNLFNSKREPDLDDFFPAMRRCVEGSYAHLASEHLASAANRLDAVFQESSYVAATSEKLRA